MTTPRPMTEEELVRLTDDALSGRRIVGELCSQRRIPRMSIPLRETDEDRVLCRALNALPSLIAEVRRLRGALEAIRRGKTHEDNTHPLGEYASMAFRFHDIASAALTSPADPKDTPDAT